MAKSKRDKPAKLKFNSATEKQLYRLSAERDIEVYTKELIELEEALATKRTLLEEAYARLEQV